MEIWGLLAGHSPQESSDIFLLLFALLFHALTQQACDGQTLHSLKGGPAFDLLLGDAPSPRNIMPDKSVFDTWELGPCR